MIVLSADTGQLMRDTAPVKSQTNKRYIAYYIAFSLDLVPWHNLELCVFAIVVEKLDLKMTVSSVRDQMTP